MARDERNLQAMRARRATVGLLALCLAAGLTPARAAGAIQTIDATVEPLVVLSVGDRVGAVANTAYALVVTTPSGRIVDATQDATKAPLRVEEGLVYTLSVSL